MSLVLALEPLARTSEGSKSGPIGLAIVLLLCIACYFLFKSMSKHLKTVREDFPKAAPPAGPIAAPARVVDLAKTDRAITSGDAADREPHRSDG